MAITIDESGDPDAPDNTSDVVTEQPLQPSIVASPAIAVPTEVENSTSHSPDNTITDTSHPTNNTATSATHQEEPRATPRRPARRARPLIEDIATPDNIRGRRPLPELVDLPQNPRMTGPRRRNRKTHMPPP